MSLFANKGATGSGLFSNSSGAGGSGGGTSGGGGGLFNKSSGTGTGGSGGGLFSQGAGGSGGGGGGLFNKQSGTGTGTGGGGLFGGGAGGGTGGTFSLNAQNQGSNVKDENDFNLVLEKFGQAIDVQNWMTCQLKYPVYKTPQSDGQPPPDTNQIKFLFDQTFWEEFAKNNPNQIGKFQFYIGVMCGVDALEQRIKNNTKLFDMLNTFVEEFRKKQDDISKAYESKLRETIAHVKRKNFLLLDKLLSVHALLEKVALQHNECNRKPNEEMKVYNKYVTLESVPNEIQTRLLDIRLNRENAVYKKPKGSLSNSTDTESKRSVLDLLGKMKKGVEILSKINQEDSADIDQMLRFAVNKGDFDKMNY